MIDLIISIFVVLLIVMCTYLDMAYSRVFSGHGEDILDNIINKLTKYISDSRTRKEYIEYFKAGLASKNVKPIVTIDDIDKQLYYSAATHTFRPNAHIGQRKLFLTEIQFFTNKVKESDNIYCIYAGAAPSNHTGYLAALFPNIKFILIDPNPFEVREANPIVLHGYGDPEIDPERAEQLIKSAMSRPEQIYIINDLFTVTLAETFHKLMKRNEMVFISDIRTNSHEDDYPDVLDILWNLAQQYVWITKMAPSWSMLKFRHPFYNEDPEVFAKNISRPPYEYDFTESVKLGLDFAKNWKEKKLVYFDGEVYIQAWPGRSSTETRLVTEGLKLKDWGQKDEYENKLFYYNQISRSWVHHYNPNSDVKLGFDNCNDCSLENHIWEQYIKLYPKLSRPFGTVKDHVIKLSKITKRDLFRYGHGYRFDKVDLKFIDKNINDHLLRTKKYQKFVSD